eukprot:TRINITY_DN63527_c0_g1_i1.p1 TRINITY_DN63527_c0_g1~~TRINITY_DN63527_c0_g1_i1.p1  ORF type:complete len:344 (-),score=55.20 TRINITY_DN63527_c0_g1_i1:67-987(-)
MLAMMGGGGGMDAMQAAAMAGLLGSSNPSPSPSPSSGVGDGAMSLYSGFGGGALGLGASGTRPRKKTQMCTFFQAGRCTKGSACTFAHDPSELSVGAMDGEVCSVHGKRRSSRNLMDDGMGGKCCAPGSQCNTGSAGMAPAMGGAGIGAALGGALASAAGGGGGDDMWKMVAGMVADLLGGAGGKGGKAAGKGAAMGCGSLPGKKTKMCMYFPTGQCAKGAACTFAHYETELGTNYDPGAAAAVMQAAAAQGGGGKGKPGKGGGVMMPGDWNCPMCGDHQFARNTACRTCGAANPNVGGGVRSTPY